MLFTPLLRLAVYTVVFSFLLGGRSVVWGMESDAGVGLMIFAGLIVFTVFSETLGSAPRLIWSNRSYVKHIPFPIEILPVAMVGASLVQAFFGAGLLMGMTLFFMNGLSVNCLYLPLVFLPLVFFTLGLSWFFSTIGVYWQDINNITQSFIQFMLFLSAIVYPLDRFISVVPQSFVALFRVNPMMTIVEDMRRILLKAMAPDWQWYGITLAGTFLCMLVGFAVFMNAKRNFSDIV